MWLQLSVDITFQLVFVGYKVCPKVFHPNFNLASSKSRHEFLFFALSFFLSPIFIATTLIIMEVEVTTCVPRPQLKTHMSKGEEVLEYSFLSLSFQVTNALIFTISHVEGKG